MTEREQKMFGMSVEDIKTQYMESLTAELTGMEMVVMGVLSDAQEMMAVDKDSTRSAEHARKQLNIAKFILCEMMDARVFKETA